MMPFVASAWAMALASVPGAAAPADCVPAALEQAGQALDAGRLHQTDAMLALYAASCAENGDYLRLKAELKLRGGDAQGALEEFQSLAEAEPENWAVAGGIGRAALLAGETELALDWLMTSTSTGEAGWREWNALGVALDRLEMWDQSAIAYREARSLAPDVAAIWNNLGYSLILQGRADEALPLLDGAARLAAADQRIGRNRTVARAMAGLYPEGDATGDRQAWAERLNNAGYGALLAGDRNAARSLFARAIEARETHFARAANNLDAVGAGQ